ncbi:DNA-3-methyladenine glycosylase [Candidatus Protochlamydia phocaeensis]|uniref:DNA-3-methyladenine glycosylase n=1 Tax=Candidatus Protochlamydia phocaeensis TaxID=1414722 RepID=UPI000AE24D22|nr:DNA-3-methyladenine glycosylase [Candidatus Protochlamydia phocaeensis]
MLPLSFFQQQDVLELSRQLLGKYLFSFIDGVLTGGIIVETEAYRAPEDRASHAYGMRRTKRNEALYLEGGHTYVYVCYGLYPLLNIVTNQVNIPHAILIRAIEPTTGIEWMLQRRGKSKIERGLTAGPGAAAQALGIKLMHNGIPLTGPLLWIEDRKVDIPLQEIIASPRVGVAYAKEDASLPWRYRIKNNAWTSPAK